MQYKQTAPDDNKIFGFKLSEVQKNAGKAMIEQGQQSRGIILHMNAGSGKTCAAANIIDTWLAQNVENRVFFVTTSALRDNKQCLIDIAENMCMEKVRKAVLSDKSEDGLLSQYKNIKERLTILKNRMSNLSDQSNNLTEIEKIIKGGNKQEDTLLNLMKNIHRVGFTINMFISHTDFYKWLKHGPWDKSKYFPKYRSKKHHILYIIDEAHLLPETPTGDGTVWENAWVDMHDHLSKYPTHKAVFMSATPGRYLLDMCGVLSIQPDGQLFESKELPIITNGQLDKVAINTAVNLMRHKIVYEDSRSSDEYAQKVLTTIEICDLMLHHIDLVRTTLRFQEQTKSNVYREVSKVHIWNDVFPTNLQGALWVRGLNYVKAYNTILAWQTKIEDITGSNSGDGSDLEHMNQEARDLKSKAQRLLAELYEQEFVSKIADRSQQDHLTQQIRQKKALQQNLESQLQEANRSMEEWSQVINKAYKFGDSSNHDLHGGKATDPTTSFIHQMKNQLNTIKDQPAALSKGFFPTMADRSKEYLLTRRHTADNSRSTKAEVNFMQSIVQLIPGKSLSFVNVTTVQNGTLQDQVMAYRREYPQLLSLESLDRIATTLINLIQQNAPLNNARYADKNKIHGRLTLVMKDVKQLQMKQQLLRNIHRGQTNNKNAGTLGASEIKKIMVAFDVDEKSIHSCFKAVMDMRNVIDMEQWHTKTSFKSEMMKNPHPLISCHGVSESSHRNDIFNIIREKWQRENSVVQEYMMAYAPIAWKLWNNIKTNNGRHVVYCTSADAKTILYRLMESISKVSYSQPVRNFIDPADFKAEVNGCLYIDESNKEGLNVFDANYMHIMNPMPRDDLEQVTSRCVRRNRSKNIFSAQILCRPSENYFPLLKIVVYDLIMDHQGDMYNLAKFLISQILTTEDLVHEYSSTKAKSLLADISRDVAILKDESDIKFGQNWTGTLVNQSSLKNIFVMSSENYMEHLLPLVTVRVGEAGELPIKIMKTDIVFLQEDRDKKTGQYRVIFKRPDFSNMVSQILDVDGASTIMRQAMYWYKWSSCISNHQEHEFSNKQFSGFRHTKVVQTVCATFNENFGEIANHLNTRFARDFEQHRGNQSNPSGSLTLKLMHVLLEHCTLSNNQGQVYELYMGKRPQAVKRNTQKILIPYNEALPGQELCSSTHLRVHRRIVFLNMLHKLLKHNTTDNIYAKIQCIHASSKVPHQSNVMWREIDAILQPQ